MRKLSCDNLRDTYVQCARLFVDFERNSMEASFRNRNGVGGCKMEARLAPKLNATVC